MLVEKKKIENDSSCFRVRDWQLFFFHVFFLKIHVNIALLLLKFNNNKLLVKTRIQNYIHFICQYNIKLPLSKKQLIKITNILILSRDKVCLFLSSKSILKLFTSFQLFLDNEIIHEIMILLKKTKFQTRNGDMKSRNVYSIKQTLKRPQFVAFIKI